SWTPSQLGAYLDVAFDAFGPERILFGSDFPVCLAAASYRRVKGVVDDYVASLSDSERARVLADNAIAFLRLPACAPAPSGHVDEHLHRPIALSLEEAIGLEIIAHREVPRHERPGRDRARIDERDRLLVVLAPVHERARQVELAVLDQADIDARFLCEDA